MRAWPTGARWQCPKAGIIVGRRVCLHSLGRVCSDPRSVMDHSFERYFLSSIAGYAIFLGFASSRRQVGSWTAQVLAGCMFFLMIADLGATIYLGMKQRIVLIEPSSGVFLSTTPSDPMRLYETLSTNSSGLDILVLPGSRIHLFLQICPALRRLSPLFWRSREQSVSRGVREARERGTHRSKHDDFRSISRCP